MENNNGDLGLIDILQVVGKWVVDGLKQILDWVLKLVFFALKMWKVLVVAAVLIAIASVASYRLQDKQYKASMIVKSNVVEAGQMKLYFDGFGSKLNNDLMLDEEKTTLLGLDSVQRSLISVFATNFCVDDDRDGILDAIDYNGRLESSADNLDSLHLAVTVCFEDITVLPALTEGFVNYISNIELVKKMNQSRLRQLDNRIGYLKDEIALLDTFQYTNSNAANLDNSLQSSGSHIVVDNRKVLLYREKSQLLEQSEELLMQRDVFSEPITIVEEFAVSPAAINSLFHILKSNLIKGLALVYLLLLLFSYYNKVKGQYMTQDAKKS